MKRALDHAYEMASAGTPDGERAALGVVRAALSADSAYGAGSLRGDTLRAYLGEKEGYLRWRLGDRAGALRAYGSVWNRESIPLPDSLGAESFRSAAYVATDSSLGPVSRADTLGAIRLLQRGITWALARGQNEVAAEGAGCLQILLADFKGDASLPRLESSRDDSSTPLLMLLCIGLGVSGLFGGYQWLQHRWYREDMEAAMQSLGVSTEGA